MNGGAVFVGANISSISGCQFQMFNGQVKIIQEKGVDLSLKVIMKTEHSEQCIPLCTFSTRPFTFFLT